MKKLLLFFFLSSVSFAYCQKDVFTVAKNGTVEEMKVLYQNNANCVNEVDKNEFSPLILAAYRGNFEVAKYLISIVKDINYQSPEGTALMAAVMRNDIQLLNLLIAKNANLDGTNNSGVTALMLAVQFKKVEIIKILLQHKANKLLKDSNGNTAFQYAVNTNEETIIELLKQ